ncbi:hypothetical protein Dimus_037752, partial [Dionaea muscipula]
VPDYPYGDGARWLPAQPPTGRMKEVATWLSTARTMLLAASCLDCTRCCAARWMRRGRAHGMEKFFVTSPLPAASTARRGG